MRRLARNLRQRQLTQAIKKALLNQPDFFAPLTHNLLLTNGQGVATFTRATSGTCWCYLESANSGAALARQVIPAGIPRFEGARWIASNNTWSDKFANGAQIPASSLKGVMIETASTNLFTNSAYVAGTESRTYLNQSYSATYTISLTLYGTAELIYYVGANLTIINIYSSPITFVADYGNITITAIGGSSIYEIQLEAKPFASSYIPTTSTPLTRNADILTYPNANNTSDTAGTIFLEATPAFNIPNSAAAGFGNNFLLDFGIAQGVLQHTNNLLRRYDGTTVVGSPSWLPAKGTTYKIGSRYDAAGQRNWLNGVAGTNGAFDGSINSGVNMRVGGYSADAASNWGGTIKNLKLYKRALTDAEITAGTS